MSRPSGRQSSAPASRGATMDPRKAALGRIADLIARGYDAGRLRREAEAVIAGLSGTMDHDALRDVLDEVREQLEAGVEAAEEQASEIDSDDKVSARNVQRMVGAMTAARDAFGRAASAL
ncbi:hypothetical protein [Pseudoroseomonas ludipueritiae]|uniref:Uncharacterized protein n=1 Tax=Pseudoroseomonas ludipueritiae TaxID=198093 RepID=A0ABR7R9M3_9PROT|nr:hypothetical protein [Pseudoroseomonas ludipueritiae]MBC9178519.1 hypothetical protein [Pseudoroseomonas ludipueritiae]MCG7360162.1 hypothetical protein [Roseomonas sp. ACRSG]